MGKIVMLSLMLAMVIHAQTMPNVKSKKLEDLRESFKKTVKTVGNVNAKPALGAAIFRTYRSAAKIAAGLQILAKL